MDAQCNWNTMESSHPSPQLLQEILSLWSPIFCLWNDLPSPLLISSHSSFLVISGPLHADFSSVWPEFQTIICSSCWGRATKPTSVESGTTLSPISPALAIFVHSFCTWFVYLIDPYDNLKSCWFSSVFWWWWWQWCFCFCVVLLCFIFFPRQDFSVHLWQSSN